MMEEKHEIKHETHTEEGHKEHIHTEHIHPEHMHSQHKQEFKIRKTTVLWIMIIGIVLGILAASILTCGFRGCSVSEEVEEITQTEGQLQAGVTEGTFTTTGDALCTENGKPIVMLFSTTWCPHCKWIKDTFDNTVKSYGDSIAAYHWELDSGDNTLTDSAETQVPQDLAAYYQKYNPEGYVPLFVFGCEYARIGNGFEKESNLTAEENEFRRMIDMLIASS
jgi:thiol-disulfide isomerase/thioredoxin